jgi:hypothetical protein
MNKFQKITIESLDNGIVVKAGCMKLVYQEQDLGTFHEDLESYIKHPNETEKGIRKRWNINSECTPQPSREVREGCDTNEDTVADNPGCD